MAEFENEYLWSQKYRPRNIEDCILPEQTKNLVKELINKKEIPHFLFAGPPGCGKTTLAKVIAEELDCDLLFLNASMENGIDALRTTVQSFASTVSFSSSAAKLVILDECLSEHERVRVGTIDSWKGMKLADLDPDTEYPVISFNMENGSFENDLATVISDKEDELFCVTLSDGRTINANNKHPFICIDDLGNFYERTIQEGLEGHDVVTHTKAEKVTTVESIGRGRVINLTVKKNHTFVTESGIVTHNCDGLTSAFQNALKGFLEAFGANCRFIFTANHPRKIIDPIHSRCTSIDFKIGATEKPILATRFMKRVKAILEAENIDYDNKAVASLIGKYFPDYRSILNELQRYSVSGSIDSGILDNMNDDSFKELFTFLKDKKFVDVRKWAGRNSDIDDTVLYRKIYDMSNLYFDAKSIPQLILILAEYSYKSGFVADREINLVACMVEIMSSCNFK